HGLVGARLVTWCGYTNALRCGIDLYGAWTLRTDEFIVDVDLCVAQRSPTLVADVDQQLAPLWQQERPGGHCGAQHRGTHYGCPAGGESKMGKLAGGRRYRQRRGTHRIEVRRTHGWRHRRDWCHRRRGRRGVDRTVNLWREPGV